MAVAVKALNQLELSVQDDKLPHSSRYYNSANNCKPPNSLVYTFRHRYCYL